MTTLSIRLAALDQTAREWVDQRAVREGRNGHTVAWSPYELQVRCDDAAQARQLQWEARNRGGVPAHAIRLGGGQ